MASREKRKRNTGSYGNNKAIGTDFLKKNAMKDGVVTTSSGLQYTILDEGEGDTPTEDSYITIHQRCLLTNGSVLEDTYKENKSIEVKLSEMLEGYQEALLMMKKGARYKLFLPPDLAWGDKGSGGKIPPAAVLIFDVRLIDFW
jgi:FKBP-type peptidyl-prolyl cis-trans isomerase FkpA